MRRSASSCRRSAASRSSLRSFTSVYYDVPGASLAASGITLRRRIEHGRSVWQLKLPATGSRLELEEPGGPARVPENLTRLLRAHLRRGPLAKVVELRTRRSGELVARDGSQAEVTLDEVSIMDGAPRARPLCRGRGRAAKRRFAATRSHRARAPRRRREARRPRRRSSSALSRPPRSRGRTARRRSRRFARGCSGSCARSRRTIRARGSAAIPKASTTCASPCAAPAPSSEPDTS